VFGFLQNPSFAGHFIRRSENTKHTFGGETIRADHSSPELTDHLMMVVYICYHAAYIIEFQTGRKWSMLQVFAINGPIKHTIEDTI
jgi:hypothetical protein